jgi:hypothetical protein
MAYDEYLADRIRKILEAKKVVSMEKKMMGGLCFMVDDKMLLGVNQSMLMARVGKEAYDMALTKPGCIEMKFTGRPLSGFVHVQDEGIDMDEDLEYWVDLCLAYNPLAKSSKKKKKK